MSQSDYCIRLATLNDWNALSALVAKMLVEHSSFDPLNSPSMVGEGILHGLRTNEAVFVAEKEGKLCGYVAWVHFPLSPEGLVSGLGTYVEPEFRKEKLSERLRQEATDFCKRKGYTTIQGVAHKDNEAGLQSSLKNGFSVAGYLVTKSL